MNLRQAMTFPWSFDVDGLSYVFWGASMMVLKELYGWLPVAIAAVGAFGFALFTGLSRRMKSRETPALGVHT